MINKGPAVPTAAATAVLGLVIGAVGGFYVHASQDNPNKPGGQGSPYGGAGGGGGGPVGGGGGGGMGGGGGARGGGGGQPSPSRDLPRLVRNLSTLEKVQNKGLTADQKKSLTPILTKLKSADTLTDAECTAQITGINAVLTADQKASLTALMPPRGGFGGGGGRGGGGGGMMGGGPGGSAGRMGGAGGPRPAAMGAGGAPGGGPGAGGGANDGKPFASEANKQALDDLLGAVQK